MQCSEIISKQLATYTITNRSRNCCNGAKVGKTKKFSINKRILVENICLKRYLHTICVVSMENSNNNDDDIAADADKDEDYYDVGDFDLVCIMKSNLKNIFLYKRLNKTT